MLLHCLNKWHQHTDSGWDLGPGVWMMLTFCFEKNVTLNLGSTNFTFKVSTILTLLFFNQNFDTYSIIQKKNIETAAFATYLFFPFHFNIFFFTFLSVLFLFYEDTNFFVTQCCFQLPQYKSNMNSKVPQDKDLFGEIQPSAIRALVSSSCFVGWVEDS